MSGFLLAVSMVAALLVAWCWAWVAEEVRVKQEKRLEEEEKALERMILGKEGEK